MLKEIPQSDIIVRPLKVYKEFSLTEEDIVPVFGKNITGSIFDADTDEQSNGIYKRLLYRSVKEQFYRNSATASILTEVGNRQSYTSTDERNLGDEIAVIAIPQQKYGEGVKVGSVRLVDNVDVEIPYVEFQEDFSAGSGSWDFSTGSMEISSTPDGGLNGDSYYLRHTNTGINRGVLSISSSLAYGVWEFDWWQSSTGTNSLRIYHISGVANPLGLSAVTSTYHMFWNTGGGSFAHQRNSGDSVIDAENFRSTGYTSTGTWYRIKVERATGGVTNVYAKGGSFGTDYVLLTATSGTNPFTDNTITTSKFFSIVLRGNSAITNIIAYDPNNTSTIQVEKEYNDDTYSNLVSGSEICGNIFYDRGMVVLTKDVVSGSTLSDFRLDYRSTNTIYENEVFLSVLENEFNVSQNPTAIDGGTYIKFNTFTSSIDPTKTGGFADYDVSSSIDPTGSYLAPYITTIGLYDNDNQMVAVAKLPRPVKSLPDYPVNFIIRFDT